MRAGNTNLITDVAGLRVGHASDELHKTGVTVLVGDRPFTASVDVMGGAPGTRETDLLAPDKVVDAVDALVLAGGSAFGLDAAAGVTDMLRKQGRGFPVGPVTVPIVPAAIIFDLLSGGQIDPDTNPYRVLGCQALASAQRQFAIGTAGAGTGATTANLKGGLGSASIVLDSGHTIGALVVANPHGSAVVPSTGQFWAAPFEVDDEFGGRGVCIDPDPLLVPVSEKLNAFNAKANTTIAIVATDAVLTKAQARRLAVSAQDGMARALFPSHTPFDGDLIFSVATCAIALSDEVADTMMLGHAASLCVARAIARGVYSASASRGDILPTWMERWGQ